MPATSPLPGFDRLLTVCRQHNLPLELSPPLPTAPRPGELLFGQPLDPLLAAVYQRTGSATLGKLSLYTPPSFQLESEALFRSLLLFGKKIGFSYYLGVVPALASAEGFQPVVYATYYPGEVSAVPIASTVDRFFDTYSRYLELMVTDAAYSETGAAEFHFPWDVQKVIAQDEPLLTLIRAGRFSHLMEEDEGASDWVRELLSPAG